MGDRRVERGQRGQRAGHDLRRLLVTRCFVGIGEGAYGPIAPAVLSDYFPSRSAGAIMAWFYMAIPVGGALGYALGGYFAELDPAGESWRWAFYVVVVAGPAAGALVAPVAASRARGGRRRGRAARAASPCETTSSWPARLPTCSTRWAWPP